MFRSDFCLFILSNARPDSVFTYKTLRKHGYTGKILIVVDNEDITADKYKENYPNEVIIFNKKEVAKYTDSGNNFGLLNAGVFARNAIMNIAKEYGFKYFTQFDDDYIQFQYRFDAQYQYIPACFSVRNLDRIFNALIDFLIKSSSLCIALCQGGDFIGGSNSTNASQVMLFRKSMQSFFCSTQRLFYFSGMMNDDVSTYVTLGSRGELFFTTNQVSLEQKTTQAVPGGMTEIYLEQGTYIKTFYSVMQHPSSVRVSVLNTSNSRIHHKVSWPHTVPKILSEEHRK